MWYILILQSYIVWVPALFFSVNLYSFELMLNEFLLLGIIPGTNIAITFDWLIALFWVGFFYWLLTKISTGQFEKFRTSRRNARINQISL
jgi:hypothetical protein